jgi:hypothetical protein
MSFSTCSHRAHPGPNTLISIAMSSSFIIDKTFFF